MFKVELVEALMEKRTVDGTSIPARVRLSDALIISWLGSRFPCCSGNKHTEGFVSVQLASFWERGITGAAPRSLAMNRHSDVAATVANARKATHVVIPPALRPLHRITLSASKIQARDKEKTTVTKGPKGSSCISNRQHVTTSKPERYLRGKNGTDHVKPSQEYDATSESGTAAAIGRYLPRTAPKATCIAMTETKLDHKIIGVKPGTPHVPRLNIANARSWTRKAKTKLGHNLSRVTSSRVRVLGKSRIPLLCNLDISIADELEARMQENNKNIAEFDATAGQ
jgi:hypothetical protein